MSEMSEEKRLEKMKQRIIGDKSIDAFCPFSSRDGHYVLCGEPCMLWMEGTCVFRHIEKALRKISETR
jgi:hypothetical protein